MARGKLTAGWSMTGSIVRSMFLSMTGTEPPLASFIPNEFLPEEQQRKKQTKAELEKIEEYKRKKSEFDTRIMTQLAREGKLKRRVNGTGR